jgi:hypothetical protein
MSVDEPTIIKRTRNILSISSSSETAQPKTKKGNVVEETKSVDEVSNLTLDGYAKEKSKTDSEASVTELTFEKKLRNQKSL